MANQIQVLNHDTEAELRKKLGEGSDKAYKTRLKAIIGAKQGKKRYEIVSQLTVDPKSVTTWLQKYNESGTDALKSNKGGRPEGNPKWDTSGLPPLLDLRASEVAGLKVIQNGTLQSSM